MKRVKVTTNTKGKVKKMIEGVVYSDPRVYVTEFLQNAYRAGATQVEIELDVEKGTATFKDNGVGLKNVEALTVLDYSTWESTNEGFGLGFWSWLGYKSERSKGDSLVCIVESGGQKVVIDRTKLTKGQTEIDVVETANEKGFKVTIAGEILQCNREMVILEERIKRDGRPMPYDVILNGEKLEQKDLHEDVQGLYSKYYRTRLFEGTFTVDKRVQGVSIYYEKRFVCTFYGGLKMGGVVEIKKGALTLREPDRKDYVYDEKYYKLKKALEKCQKDLYKTFVQEGGNEAIDSVAESIAEVLEVKEYINFLELVGKGTVNSADIEEMQQGEYMEEEPKGEDYCDTTIDYDEYVEYAEQDQEVTQEVTGGSRQRENHNRKRNSIVDEVRGEKNKVWVRVDEILEYSEHITKAEYYNVRVFVAKNKLYEEALRFLKVPHIVEIKSGVVKTNKKKNVRIKNQKEQRILELLQIACRHYSLPLNTFKIGDLALIVETTIGGKTVNKERKDNSENISVRGVAEGDSIILDRKALALERFKLESSEGYSVNDYKMVIAVLPVASHELAHLLYGTQDNTVEHYKKQEQILETLEQIYNKVM